MKPSNDLHQLIHSLSSSEKSYIKKYTAVSSNSKNNFSKLLDAIYKQEVYDEEQLLKKFRRENFVKHFAVTKKQLYDLILKLLAQYNKDQNSTAIINTAIENAIMLYERNLHTQSMKLLDKAYKMAQDHVDYLKMEEILDHKRHFIGQLKAHDWREDIDQLLEEKATLAKAELEHIEYARIYYKVLFFIRKERNVRREERFDELNQIIPNGTLEAPKHKHFYSQLHYFNVKNIYAYATQDFKEAKYYMEQIIRLWEEHPLLLERELERYVAALNNYVVACTAFGDYNSIPYSIDKALPLKIKQPRLRAVVFQNVFTWRYVYYNATARYDELAAILPEMEQTLERLKDSLNEVRYLLSVYGVGSYYFILGDYDKALDLFETIISNKSVELRADMQMSVQFMAFWAHYTLGNHLFLENALTNYRRKIRKKEALYDFEALVLHYLLKLTKVANKQEQQILLQQFLEEYNNLIGSSPALKAFSRDIELDTWIKATQQNCFIKDILIERYQASQAI